METIKISLAKPIYSLSSLDINWGECEEKDGVLKLVLNNAGAVSIFPDDTILFRRSGTIESQYRFDTDGVGTIPIKDRIVLSTLSEKFCSDNKGILISTFCHLFILSYYYTGR